MIKCSCCEVAKPKSEFQGKTITGKKIWKKCSKCRAENRAYYLINRAKIIKQASEYQRKNRKKKNAYGTEYLAKLRIEIHKKLGGRCVKCGFSDSRALQIDHVNSDGWKELRNKINSFKYLKGVLSDRLGRYQLLCANCNWIKRHENQEQPYKTPTKYSTGV